MRYSVRLHGVCVCVCSPSLSPRACLVQKKSWKKKTEIGVLWLIWNIDFTLRVDLPLIHGHTSADVRGKVSICFHMDAHTYTRIVYRKFHYAYPHRRFSLMDSPLPWRKYNSKSMR